jgi:predicted nucleic acid-binding protein
MKKLYNKFDEIVLTTVTIYELLVGVEYLGGKDRDDIETVIRNSSILLLDEIASREAAKITAELKKSGQQIGIADELIAAICKTYNTCLLTKNIGHFQRVRDLKVIGLNEI